MMKNILITLRPNQWIKNLFIFIPLIFGGGLFEADKLLKVILIFVDFCLISSSVYIINDLIDLKQDKNHPKKARRPIIQGLVKPVPAMVTSLFLFSAACILAASVDKEIVSIIIYYFLLNLIYTFYLKKAVILDVISIAIGFELRIWAGAKAAALSPSVWLQVCVFLLALFLGFAKRRYEMILLKEKRGDHRPVLAHYKPILLDQLLAICAGISVLAYTLYTVSAETLLRRNGEYLIYTLPFAVYGVFRYLYIVHIQKEGEPTEIILYDKPLLLNLLLWIGLIIFFLY